MPHSASCDSRGVEHDGHNSDPSAVAVVPEEQRDERKRFISSEQSQVESQGTPEYTHFSRAVNCAVGNLTGNETTAAEAYTVQSTDTNSIHSSSDTSTGVSVNTGSSDADSIAHSESNIETAPIINDNKGEQSNEYVDKDNRNIVDASAQSTDDTSTPTDNISSSASYSDNDDALSQEQIESDSSDDSVKEE